MNQFSHLTYPIGDRHPIQLHHEQTLSLWHSEVSTRYQRKRNALQRLRRRG